MLETPSQESIIAADKERLMQEDQRLLYKINAAVLDRDFGLAVELAEERVDVVIQRSVLDGIL